MNAQLFRAPLPKDCRKQKLRVAGLGSIGQAVIRQLSRGVLPGGEIAGVAVHDAAKARGVWARDKLICIDSLKQLASGMIPK